MSRVTKLTFALLHVNDLNDVNKYQHFTTEDFLEDEYFRKWVLDAEPETQQDWEQFLKDFPSQRECIEKAKKILLGINQHFKDEIDKFDYAERSFEQLSKQLHHPSRSSSKVIRFIGYAAAASIVLILGVFGVYQLSNSPEAQHYITSNGSRLSIQLPDSSTVELNANSSLKFFPSSWTQNNRREVWVEGEAFFDVQKKKAKTKFLVNTSSLQIEVLGTQFNVRSRDKRSEVVLAEGKIELALNNNQKIALRPGDYVSYSNVDQKLLSKKVKAADHYAWKDGMVVFNNSLSEVVRELEILYGISFYIENEELKDRQIQLSAPADGLEQVLEILRLMYAKDIEIQQWPDRIVIH